MVTVDMASGVEVVLGEDASHHLSSTLAFKKMSVSEIKFENKNLINYFITITIIRFMIIQWYVSLKHL